MFLELSSGKRLATRSNSRICNGLEFWFGAALLAVIVSGLGCGSRPERTYYCGPNGRTYDSMSQCVAECKVSLAHFVGICVPAKPKASHAPIGGLVLGGLVAAFMAAALLAAVALPLLGPGIWAWLGAESLGAAATGVALEDAVAQGLVNPSGRLFNVLAEMERAFAASPPASALDGLGLVRDATAAVGLDVGIASTTAEGEILLANVGGITTRLLTSGEIVVSRGADVLLHLIP